MFLLHKRELARPDEYHIGMYFCALRVYPALERDLEMHRKHHSLFVLDVGPCMLLEKRRAGGFCLEKPVRQTSRRVVQGER